MGFLETFGCIWSSMEVIRVIFGRALPGATSRSDFPERLHEVAVTHIPERPGQSDMEWSLAFLSRDTPLRATCQSDPPRSLAFSWRDDTKRRPERPLRATH
ncbi:hypothetical protein F2Q69_00010674 [Brassica cretica]|uniref:Uncharacterized protein n=1 Tax=Brassica cretica TaxID=69181 RepID=A0A8S9R5M9_BRACR|nr:hypothetical protein F2Q69_00010674 [Brassica cretica]